MTKFFAPRILEDSATYANIIQKLLCENERLREQVDVYENMNSKLYERVNETANEIRGVNFQMA